MSSRYRIFRHLAFDRADEPPSWDEIVQLERLLGAELSSSYRDFLAAANGGQLDYAVQVRFPDGHSESMSFGSFYSLGSAGRRERLTEELVSARQRYHIPAGVLPIARDGGGSVLFLDLTAEGRGRVVAFVDGLPAWTGRRTDSAFIELAPSFDDYVAMLQIDRESVLDTLEHDVSELAQVEATEEWLDIGLPNWRSDAELLEGIVRARQRMGA